MDQSNETAVLVPVYRGNDGEVRLVLVRRSEGGVHGGQLAFPGGKREVLDPSLADTACREANEEIGIGLDEVTILEQLPIEETMTTGFRITPFLARIVPPVAWQRAQREIAEILEVRLSDFLRPAACGQEVQRLPGTSAHIILLGRSIQVVGGYLQDSASIDSTSR